MSGRSVDEQLAARQEHINLLAKAFKGWMCGSAAEPVSPRRVGQGYGLYAQALLSAELDRGGECAAATYSLFITTRLNTAALAGWLGIIGGSGEYFLRQRPSARFGRGCPYQASGGCWPDEPQLSLG